MYRITWCIIQKIPQLVDNHNQILDYGYQLLRNKLKYSSIAFEVLSDLFTLNDIYQVYVAILGKNLTDYSNFKSGLLKLGFMINTKKKVSRVTGIPASLYRFDA
jgi:8-oxo-dGTP diphosphatase